MFDHVVAALGLLFTFCAAYLAWTGPRRKPPEKELSFGLISKAVLLATAKSVANEVSMTYQGQEVQRLSAVIVSIMNTGQLPIALSDFEKPAKVAFLQVKRIFSIVPLRCSPPHLAPSLTLDGTELFIAPLLLNPGEFMTFRAVLENTDRVTAVLEARITGIARSPVLRAGRHPGYEVGGLIYYGSLTLVTMAGLIFFCIFSLYWSCAILALPTAITIAGLVSTVRDVINIKRSRWMGIDTEDLREIDGLMKTLRTGE